MSVTRAQKQATDKSKTGHYPTPLDSEVTKESPYDGRLSREESTVKECSTTSSRASSQERSRQGTDQITQMMAMICTMNKEAEAIRRADREEAQEKQREREEQQREREEARRQADEQRWLAMFQATREDATRAMVTAEKQRAQDEERRRLETERAEQRREEIEERRRQECQEDTQIARERDRRRAGKEAPSLTPLKDVQDLETFLSIFRDHMSMFGVDKEF